MMQPPFAQCRYKLCDWIDPTLLVIRSITVNPHPAAAPYVINAAKTNTIIQQSAILQSHDFDVIMSINSVEYYRRTPTYDALFNDDGDGETLDHEYMSYKINALSRCSDRRAIAILRANMRDVSWPILQFNSHPWAVQLTLKSLAASSRNVAKQLSANPAAEIVEWLKEHPKQIMWNILPYNPHPIAAQLWLAHALSTIVDQSAWNAFNTNPSYDAVRYLQSHRDKINWVWYCANPSPTVFHELCQRNAEINWIGFSANPNIFVDEYEAVARQWFREHVAAEMMARVWHPRNMARFKEWGEGEDIVA